MKRKSRRRFRIDADDTNAHAIADLDCIGHTGHAMRGNVPAEVNDRSSSKFKAPVTALVLIAVITFVPFMLISGEGALSALSAHLIRDRSGTPYADKPSFPDTSRA